MSKYIEDGVVATRLSRAIRSMRNVRKNILALGDDVRLADLVKTTELLRKKLMRMYKTFETADGVRRGNGGAKR
jgi:hypothetical protein